MTSASNTRILKVNSPSPDKDERPLCMKYKQKPLANQLILLILPGS